MAIIPLSETRISYYQNKKRRPEIIPWVGANKKRFDSTMFKLTY